MSNANGEPQHDDPFDAGHLTEESPEEPVASADDAEELTSPEGYPEGGFSRPEDAFVTPEKPKHRWTLIAAALVGALVVGGASGGVVSAINSSDDPSSTSSSATSNSSGIRTVNEEVNSKLADTVAQAQKSVVTISVTVSGGNGGTGSGIVLNDEGYIVTNAHVATLEGQSASGQLAVQTSTGDVYKATLVGYDATADTAVIKISASAKGVEPITFANSDQVEVGDQTIAIGAPLGLSGTVTSGIVSAINRPISVASSKVQPSTTQSQQDSVSLNAIQTDAAINSGNSGGALLNAAGDLIGMNDAIATSGDSTGSIGIGFSIPANYVKRVAQEIIANGSATHGMLGASVGDASASNSSTFGFGAEIQSVTSTGAAAAAGLKAGDVITKMNDTVITDATQLTALVREQAANASVKITYTRGSTPTTVNVTLKAAS